MFACCDADSSSTPPLAEDALELHEKPGELVALLRLLHDPPTPPAQLPVENKFDPIRYDPTSVIPLPILLSLLFVLTDKYALDEDIAKALRVHLIAHAPAHALEVYSFATAHEMEWEANAASQYILPMASYRFEEIKMIPNVVAYHKLVRLQDFRVKAIRELLLGEEIFPHGKAKKNQPSPTHWVHFAEKSSDHDHQFFLQMQDTEHAHPTAIKRPPAGIDNVKP